MASTATAQKAAPAVAPAAAERTYTTSAVTCTEVKRNTVTGITEATLRQTRVRDGQEVKANGLFGAEELTGRTEERILWLEVPKGSTVESVSARLAKFPEARIAHHYSFSPILEGQEGEKTAERQLRRGRDGKPLLQNNKQYYMRPFFAANGEADKDERTVVLSEGDSANAPF